MRIGELVSLKKSDFIDDRYLHIQRTETKAMGKGEDMGDKMGITYVADQPKTEAGNRQVYLCEEAVEVVKKLIADPIAVGQEWLLLDSSLWWDYPKEKASCYEMILGGKVSLTT